MTRLSKKTSKAIYFSLLGTGLLLSFLGKNTSLETVFEYLIVAVYIAMNVFCIMQIINRVSDHGNGWRVIVGKFFKEFLLFAVLFFLFDLFTQQKDIPVFIYLCFGSFIALTNVWDFVHRRRI